MWVAGRVAVCLGRWIAGRPGCGGGAWLLGGLGVQWLGVPSGIVVPLTVLVVVSGALGVGVGWPWWVSVVLWWVGPRAALVGVLGAHAFALAFPIQCTLAHGPVDVGRISGLQVVHPLLPSRSWQTL